MIKKITSKTISLYEEDNSLFSDLVGEYITDVITENDEILLGELISKSNVLKERFTYLLKIEIQLRNSRYPFYIIPFKYVKIGGAISALAALIWIVFQFGFSGSKINLFFPSDQIHLPVVNIERSIGDCSITSSHEEKTITLMGKNNSICDYSFTGNRKLIIRLVSDSKLEFKLNHLNWEFIPSKGRFYFQSNALLAKNILSIILPNKYQFIFMGTSVYLEYKNPSKWSVSLFEGSLMSKNLNNQEIMVNAEQVLYLEESWRSPRIKNQDRDTKNKMKSVFNRLKMNNKEYPSIDWKELIEDKNLKEVLGDNVLLKDGSIINATAIFQEEDLYHVVVKGKLETFQKNEIEKIKFR